MATVQLPGIQSFDTKMEMHTKPHNSDVSLIQEFQKHSYHPSRKHDLLDYTRHKNFK